MFDTAMWRAQLLAAGELDELLTPEQQGAIAEEQQLLDWMVENGAADPADAQAAPLEDYNAPEAQPYDPPPPWET
eukprot:5750603-Pyramimonas_sp.AAC.1